MLVLPKNLLETQAEHRTIKMKGCTVIESCLYNKELTDSAYISDHELIYIISGQLTINETTIKAGEAILVRKDSCFDFRKAVSPKDDAYRSILFFLKKEFIQEFVTSQPGNRAVQSIARQHLIKISKNHLLDGFIQSLIPYFEHPLGSEQAVIKLKIFELLYQLTESEKGFLFFLLNLNEGFKISLPEVMEKNFTKKLTVGQLAAISGRSLSAFKRDFKEKFHTTPARWIKSRRLKLAKQLLELNGQKPSAIYLEVGFEDYAHFSKEFKKEFGQSPSQL